MARRLSLALFLALISLIAFAWVPGCGGDPDSGFGDPTADGSVNDDGSNGGGGFGDSSFGDGSGGSDGPFSITPINQTIDVAINNEAVTANPTQLAFKGKISGQDVDAAWSLDRGELGAIAASGVFTPSNTVARALSGVVRVTARYQAYTASTTVTIRLHITQNGKPSNPGGGGVGGSPIGSPVDNGTKGRLQGTAQAAPDFVFLYPYDNTVWPRGLFAPLMQWQTGHAAKAVYIHLKENGFEFEGFSAGNGLVNQPIWQAAWDKATYGNLGDPLTVEIKIDDGAKAYGPIKRTWTVAPGALKGTVYYNSYDTHLTNALPSQQSSAGVLAIKPGTTQPTLALGAGTKDQCVVCHTVSGDGSTLFAQIWNGDTNAPSEYKNGFSYDLRGAKKIADYVNNAPDGTTNNRKFLWSGVSNDGTYALQSSNQSGGHTQEGFPDVSRVFRRDNGNAVTSTGFDGVVKEAVTPAFSPDGKKVAFNHWTGTGGGNGHSLAVMNFACGAGGGAPGPSCGSFGFSGLHTVYTNPNHMVGWPAWLPDGGGIVFHNVVTEPTSGAPLSTWKNAQAELWYVGVNGGQAVALKNLNGAGYLPTNAQHPHDAVLNYEPTVNPIASGGYYWVVYTSRRMYGNVAAGDPYATSGGNQDIALPKKLWVAAIDMHPAAGKDPSHPGFYLPAQELYAGNMRGFWVVDPCKANGNSCETGDECCNGFCRQGPSGSALVCVDKPQGCSQEFENCNVDADCCGAGAGYKCVNNRCAIVIH